MKFENLVTLINEKLFAQTDEIKKRICPAPTDLAYVVHFMDNSLQVILRTGPMRREELDLQFQPNRGNVPSRQENTSF